MKEQYGLLHIFYSNKEHGNMAKKYSESADTNRKKFITDNGIQLERCLFMQPNNGDHIVELKKEISDCDDLYYKLVEADAIICKVPNVYLYLHFGDCIPFVIYDRKQQIFAFAHLGRKSVDLNLHQKLFDLFINQYHSEIKNLEIHLGPSIKKESYLLFTPEEKENIEWKNYVCHVKEDLYSVDLNGYVVDYFYNMGLKEDQVYNSFIDTYLDLKYFSHYRSKNDPNEAEGRFLYMVGMSKKEE